jgi:hypothetical protein
MAKKVSHQSEDGEVIPSGGNKFRRTLSHGLAFISNPLSQRKITPGRKPLQNPTIAATELGMSAYADQYEFLASTRNLVSVEPSNSGSATNIQTLGNRQSSTKSVDLSATQRVLPRSRTTSFLPRPIKPDSDASATDSKRTVKLNSPATNLELRGMPSKIPTSGPPLSELRVSSPRQYLSHQTSIQGTYPTADQVFAATSAGSPSKTAMKSHTTPSLVKSVNTPQQLSGFITLRKGGQNGPTTSLSAQEHSLQENIPTNTRITPRRSQRQEKIQRRESLAVPTITNIRSFVQEAEPSHSKQSSQDTQPIAKKRLSSNSTQRIPITTKHIYSNQKAVYVHRPIPTASSSPILQPRLMGPRNPPTPTPLLIDATKSAPPRSNTDEDLPRKALGTPNGFGGVWRSSRTLAATNHEVRRLPRSSTFHNFGASWGTTPSVPPIPEQYRIPSFSSFFESLHVPLKTTYKPRHFRMVSNAPLCKSISEEQGERSHQPESPTSSQTEQDRFISLVPSESADDLVALPSLPHQLLSISDSMPTQSKKSLPSSHNRRPWSISDCQHENAADVELYLQVRDYMQPLYWAGRFQSRFDQWRTTAMMTELNPNHCGVGQLGQCKLNEEKSAACYIFAQLRDLCLTDQAADSLWVRQTCPLFAKARES